MGERGPIPKRSEERRRPNTTDSEGARLDAETVEVEDEPVDAPEADEEWHQYAIDFYNGCVDSVQARFFEPSDWQALRMACEVQSRLLKKQPMKVAGPQGTETIEWVTMPVKGADLSALSKVWSSLLVTEGDRRRLRLEIKRAAATPALPATPEQVTQDRAGLFAVPG